MTQRVRDILSINATRQMAALSPEERRERAIRGNAKLTPTQRTARALLRESRMTPQQRRDRSLRAAASQTPDERSETARKRQQSKTPEQRSAQSLVGVQTRKNNGGNYKPRNGINKLCNRCGASFYVKASWADKTKYCSNSCRIANLREFGLSEEIKEKISRAKRHDPPT